MKNKMKTQVNVKFPCQLVLLLLLLMLNCKQQDPNVVIINDDDALEVNFDDVATDIRVVPIKSEELINGSIMMLSYNDHELLMLDNRQKTIYYFYDNVLRGKLNAIGRGPGEYKMIDKFTYSPEEKMLYVTVFTRGLVLKYSVPDMKFCGKIQVDARIGNLAINDNKTFLMAICNDSLTQYSTQIVDKISGDTLKRVQMLNASQYNSSDRSFSNYSSDSKLLSTWGTVNTIGIISNKNKYEVLFKYSYGKKGIPDRLYNFDSNDSNGPISLLRYRLSDEGEQSLEGCYFPKKESNEISFWYNIAIPNDAFYCFYRQTKDSVTHYKGFKVAGLNIPIVPKCSTESGYVSIFEGTPDSYIDSMEVASPLAKRILDTMREQKDNNPVLVYYNIK
jgi:hypothetical protein